MTTDSPALLAAAARQSKGARPYLPRRQQTVAQMRARQLAKIREFRDALAAAGFVTLDEQAKMLGLCRSTTWTILKANYKSSGLSATIINRILAAPQLPPLVRVKILEYVEEKAAGLYGHGKTQRRKFIALLSCKQVERGHVEEILPLQPKMKIAKDR